MPFLNFTGLGSSYSVVYNTSYIIANQPPLMTTMDVWLATAGLGIALLLVSVYRANPMLNDLAGILAFPALLLATLQSFAIDTITGIVMAPGADAPYMGVLVETHTVYHYDLAAVFLGIITIFAVLNLYLLWLDYTRISEQDQQRVVIDKVPERNKPKQQKPDEDEE